MEVVPPCAAVTHLFLKTIHNEDSLKAQRYREYLVETRIPKSIRIHRVDFTYEIMIDKLTQASDRSSVLKSIDNSFRKYLEALYNPEFVTHDSLFDDLEKLANLSEYDFSAILRPFDPFGDFSSRSYAPNFVAVRAEELLSELLDLYFVLAPVNISAGLEEIIFSLVAKLKRANERDRKNAVNCLNNIRKFFNEALSGGMLEDLIWCIEEEPDFRPEFDQTTHNYIASYKRNVTERYEKNKERCVREAAEESISKDFTALFGKVDLIECQGYNEAEREKLVNLGFEGFSYVRALRMLKSYYLAKYEGDSRNAIRRLEADGFFESMEFKQNLSEAYSGCEDITGDINRFEEDITGVGTFSITALHELLNRHRLGEKVTMEINKIVDTLNNRVKKIVDDGTSHFYRLASLLKDVLDDHRSTKLTYVSNIRVIAGRGNRDFIAVLRHACNDIVKFVRIVRHFAVIDPGALKPS